MVRLLTPDSSVEWCSPMVSVAALHLSYAGLTQNLSQMFCKNIFKSRMSHISGINSVLSGYLKHHDVIWFVFSSWVGLEWGRCICEGADIISIQGVLWDAVFGRHRALLYTGKHRVPPAKPCYRIHEKGKLVTVSRVNEFRFKLDIMLIAWDFYGKFWVLLHI